MPRMLVSAPHFLVADVRRAAEYYRDKLGFRIIGYFFEEPPVFGMVDRDRAEIHLRRADDGLKGSNGERVGDALDCYIRVDDVEALHAEFNERGAEITLAPTLQSYGMKEVYVRDPDGYTICFGQEMGKSEAD
jgi:catechol 2,3-dioxygenase-like lactoylglutathione lyase family enzyme